jgi:hypothetical protein
MLALFIYIITRLASNEIFSPSNKIHREVGRAKDLSAPAVYLLPLLSFVACSRVNFTFTFTFIDPSDVDSDDFRNPGCCN